MLDESGCPRIRIARDPGGNQTRQTGLDDTKNKVAMTAGNTKVHGKFPRRKGRASAAVGEALDALGGQGHVAVPLVSRRSPSIRPNVAAGSKSFATCEAYRVAVARGSPRQRYLMNAASPGASTTNAASSRRRKIARQTGPAARSTLSTGAPGCDACQIRSRGKADSINDEPVGNRADRLSRESCGQPARSAADSRGSNPAWKATFSAQSRRATSAR